MFKPFLILIILAWAISTVRAEDHCATENVILVTLDGVRWQEIFQGIDPEISKQSTFFENTRKQKSLMDTYGSTPANVSRQRIMPFLWTVIGGQGQLYGNRAIGSEVDVINPYRRSYPGYAEMLTGIVDPDLETNDKVANPNVSVFEFLESRDEFRGQTALIASWGTFPFIVNAPRYQGLVNAGFVNLPNPKNNPIVQELNELQWDLPSTFGGSRYDAITLRLAFEYIEENQPRFLHIALNDPDAFAHKRDYASYVNAIHQSDAYLSRLWNRLQQHTRYKEKTTLIVTTDHGRGDTPETWNKHGSRRLRDNRHSELIITEGTNEVWLAVIGPDSPAMGEVHDGPEILLGQLAATMASLLGENFTGTADVKGPEKPISSLFANGFCH